MSEAKPTESLTARTVKGAGWLIGWRLASRLLGIVNTVVLVRLLTPSDFGLVALATSFATAIDNLSYLGVQDALVREHAPDRGLYDTGFTMNVVRGLVTALIIVGCAYPAAKFFGDARLATIFQVLAVAMFLSSLDNIGTIDFQRDLSFGKQVQVLVVPRIVSIVASISAAVVWRSYWALVVGVLVMRGGRLVYSYVVHPYRPRITLHAWRRLISFSFWSWALSMTSLVQGRSDAIIIGGFLNPTAVGIYSVGGEIGSLASTELLEPISRALFAGFSSARRSGGGIAAAYIKAISVVALVTLPANAGIALIARPMMHLVFGTRWDAAVPLIQLFACIGVVRVAAAISAAVLMAEGVPQIGFRIELASATLRVVALLCLVPRYGLIGAAAGIMVTMLFDELVYLIVTFRHARLRARDLVPGLWRPILATSAMALILLAFGRFEPFADAGLIARSLHLATMVLFGCAVYGATLLLTWFAAGRPIGAESHTLTLARDAIRQRLDRSQ